MYLTPPNGIRIGCCLIMLFLFLLKHFICFYYTFCFLYPDEITSIDHIGIKSNELFQLKQGLLADFSDAKLNEVLKSNNLDVSDEIICLSLSKFPFLLIHTNSIYIVVWIIFSLSPCVYSVCVYNSLGFLLLTCMWP